jgi:hypothetical protein
VSTVWRALPVVAVLGVALMACQAVRKADADPAEFTLGKEFILGAGQQAVSGADDLRVRFSEVLEDSRCPTEVECFWTGQARIAVLIEPAGIPLRQRISTPTRRRGRTRRPFMPTPTRSS